MTSAVGAQVEALRTQCVRGLRWAFATAPFLYVVKGDEAEARRLIAKLQPHERALVAEFATTLLRLASESRDDHDPATQP